MCMEYSKYWLFRLAFECRYYSLGLKGEQLETQEKQKIIRYSFQLNSQFKVYCIKSYISINNLPSSATAAPRACLGKLKLEFQEKNQYESSLQEYLTRFCYMKYNIRLLLLYLRTSPCAAMFHCKHPGGPRIIIYKINHDHKQSISKFSVWPSVSTREKRNVFPTYLQLLLHICTVQSEINREKS